jgi:hypothetical protein
MHCCYLAKTTEERPAETHTETEVGDAGFSLGYLAYTVKKVTDFPVPSRDVTYQTPFGRE